MMSNIFGQLSCPFRALAEMIHLYTQGVAVGCINLSLQDDGTRNLVFQCRIQETNWASHLFYS